MFILYLTYELVQYSHVAFANVLRESDLCLCDCAHTQTHTHTDAHEQTHIGVGSKLSALWPGRGQSPQLVTHNQAHMR